MKQAFVCLCTMLLVSSVTLAQKVHLTYDASLPQARYAASEMGSALQERGYPHGNDFLIRFAVDSVRLEEEAYDILHEEGALTIRGGDGRGLIYGAFSVIEDLRNGVALVEIPVRSERAHLPFRAIKHNLPWDSYRASSALDLHWDTMQDLQYWRTFLDMMAENRFNALTLWNLHPFTYMIMPNNFPEASPFTREELEEWQHLYRGIFALAKERGIDTYIVNWNIFVSREFAEAHQLAGQNYYPHYFGDGDTSDVVKRYIRESVTQVLEEYPDLTGIGLSHGEGMGGMTPQQRQDWIDETIIEGMRLANRKSRLIHRVPFSANLGSGGSTSEETERLTREAMEAIDFFDGPIWVEMKFNWSHAHSTPKLVKVHGGALGDTYFEPAPENYKIAWMARNEDFFALRWGVPSFIRAHLANNAYEEYVGGYFVGSETYIPAKDYFTAIDEPVNWTYAFERQWLFYKLWGRLLYNPATGDEVFRADFVRRYGTSAAALLEAYALASATPLRLASSFDLSWDFTLYSEGFMALNGPAMEYISVDRMISRPPLDPDYVSVEEFVKTISSGGVFEDDKITPVELIGQLETDCREALRLVGGIDTARNASLMYEVADVKAWANLGLHFAEKLRGAIALQTYRLTGEEVYRQEAVSHLEKALRSWDTVIDITRPLYRDMPLTHYNRSSHVRNDDDNLFHWARLRPEVARDIEIARNANVTDTE